MGIIKVETPQGIVSIEIEGDEPTEQELDDIDEEFFASPVVAKTRSDRSDIDLATASVDEIRDYARTLRAQGIDPSTGEPLTEEEYVSNYKEPGVDYKTGVDSVGGFSRFQFGRMDTLEEKQNYLNTVVGSDGFRTDPLGRLILTKTGRNVLGLGEGRELAVDEEGLSFKDVKDFAGATALPIAAGVGATIAASGVGFLPGMLIVGAATGAGKALDEGIEYAEGLQRQSVGEVARDSAFEALFGGLGEGVGRGISRLFGRIIKGPGGEANEALRAQAREIITKGYRPTIAGSTDESFRPILNRLQAVYEGIFPNAKAASQNLDNILDELRSLGVVDKSQINNLDEVVRNDIKTFYSTSDQKLADAQKRMDDAVRGEISQVMKNLRDGDVVPEDLADMIRRRKVVFDEDADRLYSEITKVLRGQKIIPTAAIKAELDRLTKDTIADIGATEFARKVNSLGKFATAQELGRIRSGLTEASKTPSLLNDVNVGALGSLKKAVNDAFIDTEITLAKAAQIKKTPSLVSFGQRVIRPEPEGFSANLSYDELAEGLNLLRRTNEFYRKGIGRFDNLTVQEIYKGVSKNRINMDYIFDNIITKNQPEALEELLKAIKGVSTQKLLGTGVAKKGSGGGIVDLAEGTKILKSRTIGNRSVEQALKDVADLPDGDPVKRSVQLQAKAIEQEAAERATIRGRGAEMAEQVRQSLAKRYLEKQINQSMITEPSTGQRVIDPIKFVANLREKGTVIDKLFGKDLKTLNDVMSVLERGKANLAPGVIAQLRSKPLGQSLQDLQAAQASRIADDRNFIINTLQSTTDPDVIAQTVFRNPAAIKQAQKILTPQAMELTRDAAMGRILKQIGATVDDVGEIRITDDLIDSFKSGRLGTKLQSVLRSYGDETLDAMFGPNGANGLNAMAETMVRASNAAIAGKGGLAAPQIALGLGVVSLIMNPLATLPTALAYGTMSKLLRNRKVLEMMMASRKPNTVKQFLSGKFKANDPIAQGLQTVLALVAAAGVQSTRGLTQQTAEEAAPAIEQVRPEIERQTQLALPTLKQAAQQLPVISPPSPASSVGNINPITVPDPLTRATFGQP